MSGKWTDRQLDAINAENTAVIVSAAAGSGKTSVLVERLLRLLSDEENKISADRIIVVTFTNDAAAQMKQRLSEALSERIEAEPENMWLRRQQSLIPSAKISTIHSFCFDMIRENVRSLDISAGFRILDDTEERLLTAKASAAVFEEMYEKDPGMMNFLSDFTGGEVRGDGQLEAVVLEIYRFLSSQPFPDEWLDKAAERYGSPFDEKKDPLAEIYAELVLEDMNRLAMLADHAAELCSEAGESKAYGVILSERDMFLSLAEKASDAELEWNERFGFPPQKWETARYPKTEEGSPERAVVDKVKSIRDNYKKKYTELVNKNIFTKEDISDDYEKNHTVLKELSAIVKAVSEEVRRMKSERNALGFSDAEQLSVKLLCERDGNGEIRPSVLAKELSGYYKLIMIDEFQDANNTQNLIFRMLSHNGTADKGGDNFFAVGDVKQSIYRFRLANPKIFTGVLDSSEPYREGFSGDSAAVLLNRNFRSSGDVVDFVNDVFENIMTVRTGGIDYTEAERLEAGAVYPEADRAAEFIFAGETGESVSPAADSEDEPEEEGQTAAEVNAEAYAAALKIKSMLGVAKVYEKGAERPCECRDFCILLRDRARGRLYADALAGFGIRAVCEETAGYLRSREIAVLINLLTVIDNPMKDIPLMSVLMSPMFMLTADEAAELRLMTENRGDRMYKCVLAALDKENSVKYSAVGKLEHFSEIYGNLRVCAATQSLSRLIRTVYDSTDFLSSVQAYADGEQKKANLRLLLEYAESYDSNSAGGLSGFIRYLHDISENGGDFVRASAVPSAGNAVSVKTIHKSKGLEYPFVFLCGTSKPFNKSDINARMQINLDYGIGFRIQDREKLKLYDSFPRYVLSRLNLRETVSEEMRLLYVALTRARERLFITVPDNEKTARRIEDICTEIAAAGGIEGAAEKAGSMQDWLLSVLLTHPDGKAVRKDTELPVRESRARIKVTYSGKDSTESTEKAAESFPLPDGESVRLLLDRFSFKYDSRLPETLARLTITEIAKSESEEIFLRRPEFSAAAGGLTAAEAGTAMHTFMQYADYAAAEADPVSQAEILTEKGILSEAEKNALRYEKLSAFFRSELYGRMKKSPEIRREQKFLIEISQLGLDGGLGMEYNNTDGMLQGIADCFFAEEDGIVLVDYKTDRVSEEKVLADRYRRQLVLYGAALEKIFGRKVRGAYLYSFALDKEVKII